MTGNRVGSDFPCSSPARKVAVCEACRRQGYCRLGIDVECFDAEAGIFHVGLHCPTDHEGGPEVAHGGWTASVLDEVLGFVPIHHGALVVTGRLEVEYVKPVPITRPLIADAQLERREGRRWFVHGELRLASTGAVLAMATGIWVEPDARHVDARRVERYEAWLSAQGAGVPPG
jgi:acyl-coenzyme A thioesterase PaaI-like protein